MSRVWIDGTFVNEDAAHVPALGAGVLTGMGVFESMHVTDGEAFAITRHLRRLRISAGVVGLALGVSDATLRAAIVEVARDHIGPARLRVTATAAPVPEDPVSVIVHAVTIAPWPATCRLTVSPWVRNERAPSSGAKTTSYVDNALALRDARRLGTDEAVLCDTRGFLSEGTSSNLFLVRNRTLLTPSSANGCLAGVTRELLIELVDVIEADTLTVDDLHEADEVFLTSSTRNIQPVSFVDGLAVADCPGPVTARAAASFAALRAHTIDP